ncbi:hypothetical protein [Dactylosporangium sp. CA-139066]
MPEETAEDRQALENLQRAANANNKAVREQMARGEKPIERRAGRS